MSGDISFIHGSGGLVSEGVLGGLTVEKPEGPAEVLANAPFHLLDGTVLSDSALADQIEWTFDRSRDDWHRFGERTERRIVVDRLLVTFFERLGYHLTPAEKVSGDDTDPVPNSPDRPFSPVTPDGTVTAVTHFGWATTNNSTATPPPPPRRIRNPTTTTPHKP